MPGFRSPPTLGATLRQAGVGDANAQPGVRKVVLEDGFAVGGEAGEDPGGGQHVDIAGFSVDARAADGVTVVGDIGEEVVETPLPLLPAGFGVDADQYFLQVGAYVGEPVLQRLGALLPASSLQSVHDMLAEFDFRGAEAATRQVATG